MVLNEINEDGDGDGVCGRNFSVRLTLKPTISKKSHKKRPEHNLCTSTRNVLTLSLVSLLMPLFQYYSRACLLFSYIFFTVLLLVMCLVLCFLTACLIQVHISGPVSYFPFDYRLTLDPWLNLALIKERDLSEFLHYHCTLVNTVGLFVSTVCSDVALFGTPLSGDTALWIPAVSCSLF